MAQSPEYPRYRWVEPRSWTNASREWMDPIHLIVIHTTEGSEGRSSAEDGAAYDQRRTDGTSTHFFVDADSVVQCVRTADIAHTARAQGNVRGIHIEVCGRAGQSAAQWADAASAATIEQLAGLCKVLLQDYPAPLVNLTPAQVRAGKPGFCEHKDISLAFGQSDHTDPGPNFPWERLFRLIEEDDDMAGLTEDQARAAALGGTVDAFKLAAAQADDDQATEPGPTGRQMASYIRTLITNPILAAIAGVDEATAEAVLAAIGNVDRPAGEVAELLRPVLGDRAEAVGRVLAGLTAE